MAVFAFRRTGILIVGIFLFYAVVQCEDSGFFSSKEKALIKQLRDRVKGNLTQPIMHEDNYLIRFLRAQKHRLDDAEKMIHRTLAWRRQEHMDTIFSEDWSTWTNRYPFSLNMHDYRGKLAISAHFGDVDVRRLILSGKQQELDRYLIYAFERGLYNVQQGFAKTGHIDGYLIFNLAGYSPKTHACLACLPSWLKMIVSYESYYPQLCTKIFGVNTPRIFEALLDILKTVLSSHTLQIINLYDYNMAHWTKELYKTFPKNVLTPEFGGTGPVVKASSIHNQDLNKIINYTKVFN